MVQKDTTTVLNNLKTTLEMAEYGLMDLVSKNPRFHELGLRNLAMHGRSVTFVLQNLRNIEPEFNDWYEKIQEEIKSSDLCRFFKDLRNEIEKQGQSRSTKVSARFSFSTNVLERLPRPKDCKIVGFFIADRLGGSGWDIELPDGRKDKIYLDLPKEMVNVKRVFSVPPKDHLGVSLEGKSIQELGEIYYTYLADLVNRAMVKFG